MYLYGYTPLFCMFVHYELISMFSFFSVFWALTVEYSEWLGDRPLPLWNLVYGSRDKNYMEK